MKRSERKKEIRERLFKEQNGKCCFCERQMHLPTDANFCKKFQVTLEHITPKHYGGGGYSRHKVAASCRDCNNKRGCIPFDIFKAEKLWRHQNNERRYELLRVYQPPAAFIEKGVYRGPHVDGRPRNQSFSSK